MRVPQYFASGPVHSGPRKIQNAVCFFGNSLYQQTALLVSGSFGAISENAIVHIFEKARENDENDIEDIGKNFNSLNLYDDAEIV